MPAHFAVSRAPELRGRARVGILVVALLVLLIAVVVVVIAGPLRAAGAADRAQGSTPGAARSRRDADALVAELASAREAKYQEIRDAELDYRMGKLSRPDYDAIDASLRAEAIDILDRLEAAEGASTAEGGFGADEGAAGDARGD